MNNLSQAESTREASAIQENRIAKKFGGRRNANSGAGHFAKGDVIIPEIKLGIECKTSLSLKDSFSIKRKWIEKSREEMYEMRLDNSVIAFNFYYDDNKDYYVINDKLMKYLVECLKKDYTNS